MDVNKIKSQYESLQRDLKKALSTMEKTDLVLAIRESIKGLQQICPHNNGSFDFSLTNECPYCGTKFRK